MCPKTQAPSRDAHHDTAKSTSVVSKDGKGTNNIGNDMFFYSFYSVSLFFRIFALVAVHM